MSERWNKILDILAEHEKMEVTRLSELLQVSQVTIRKDLVQLENKGIINREHGYATLNCSDDINHRLAYHYDIKQKIAKLAIADVADGETVMIESGSCCALVACELVKNRKDITLITNSAFIADYVRKEGIARIILLGGEYQSEAQIMVGPLTRKCVETFFVDKLFIGTDGFSEKSGFTGNDYMRSETVRDMARQANHVIVVSESAKFYSQGVVNLLDTSQVSCVVTDNGIPSDSEEYLRTQNIEVRKAE